MIDATINAANDMGELAMSDNGNYSERCDGARDVAREMDEDLRFEIRTLRAERNEAVELLRIEVDPKTMDGPDAVAMADDCRVYAASRKVSR